MKSIVLLSSVLLVMVPAQAQHHYGSWIYKNASDTTIVPCWNDSLTQVQFPGGSMMGMMYPDSIYCRIDRMDLDSLFHPHDSTFIGWHRIQMGRDSMHYDMMDDSMMGGHYEMQFMDGLACTFRWDSLTADSLHRHWQPSGLRGWTGSQWVSIQNVMLEGCNATVVTQQVYSAVAFVGVPPGVTGVEESVNRPADYELRQNYPNPFNPTTTIIYALPSAQRVRLSVYNLLGQEVRRLVDGIQDAGIRTVTLDGIDLASGVYIYRLRAGAFSDSKKLLVVK